MLFRSNLRGNFNVLRAAGRIMTAQRAGSIVLLTSIRSLVVEPLQGVYAATKAGIVQLAKTAAAEFGPHGVRVSWLLSPGSPGYDDHDGQPDGAGAVPGAAPGEAEAAAAPGTAGALGTEGAPGTVGLLSGHLPSYGEVANVAVFAASDWARTITASEINFTGGAVVD